MFIHNPRIQKLARVKVTAAALSGIFPQCHLSVPRGIPLAACAGKLNKREGQVRDAPMSPGHHRFRVF
jgi:hypothetical protein